MSALSATAGSLPASSLPAIDPATEPYSVKKGGAAAQKAYQTGLAFEDMLVNELAQTMTATVPGLDGGTDDGLGGTTDSGDSGSSSSGGLGAYSSLLPQALTSSIMSNGGTGVALQIAKSLDPSLGVPTK
jgi:Rod binding domain-containing protein